MTLPVETLPHHLRVGPPLRVVVLSGGVGGARFTRGLLTLLGDAASVTVIANTGDDLWLHGVRVCPDLDTLMYTLAGVVHERQGWGRDDETREVAAELAGYRLGWDWFTLGDKDLATCLARTELLRRGRTLSQATATLAQRWELDVTLLPMSDQPVETHVRLTTGELIHFEEWWVRHRAGLPAAGFEQVGLTDATAAPGVLAALADADLVVLPPSNPVVSIGTVLAVPGVHDALVRTAAPVVGISPIVAGAPVRGMADACLTAIGVATSADAVARHYGRRADGGVLDAWLVDDADAGVVPSLLADGFLAASAPTLMTDLAATTRIAAAALDLVGVRLG